MPKFEKGPANPRWSRSPRPEHNPEALLDQVASSPEEIATAEREREQLSTLAGQAPAEPAGQAKPDAPAYQRPSTLGTEPLPPMAPVDVEAVSKARQAKLDAIEEAGERGQALAAELAEQERNAAALVEQMKAERLALVQEKERLEQEAIRLQHEITRADALAQAQALEEAAAAQKLLVIDEQAAWRDKVKAQVKPLVEMVQAELQALQVIQGGSAEVFGRAAAHKVDISLSQIGDGGQIYHALDAACESCHKVNEDIKASIAQCQRALADVKRLFEYQLPPDTADGRLRISRVTTDLGYCNGHAENARLRAEGAMSHFVSASKAAAPYLKVVKPVRPADVVVSLDGEDRQAIQRRMMSRGIPPAQTHAAGMNTDPLA